MDFETLEASFTKLNFDQFSKSCESLQKDKDLTSDDWYNLGIKSTAHDSAYGLICFLISSRIEKESNNIKPESFDRIAEIYFVGNDHKKAVHYGLEAYKAQPSLERATLINKCFEILGDGINQQKWEKIKEKHLVENKNHKAGGGSKPKPSGNLNKVANSFGQGN